ncbi:MAG TPA: cobalamin biosynthesis protein [Candidatus Sulfotelmatobacter sp.]|nr:cobalamin biosynthesis protein [Candidatus Sulfotelmatobacter sp.]
MSLTDFSFLIDSLLIILIAFLIDAIFGEVPDRLHPTVWMGKVISFFKPRIRNSHLTYEKLNGILLALLMVILFAIPSYFTVFLVRQFLGEIPYVIVAAILLKMTFARKCMGQYTLPIAQSIEKNDLEGAKRWLHYIVRRDPATLSEHHIISAAVESIAESTTDGITSPFFYFAIFGIPGAFAYRVINTLDSMVGYKDEANRNIGWFSANLDTIANYIPTRLTALLMVISALFLHENWRESWRIIQRDRHKMSSINAGWTIAAMAGAVSTQLEKPGFYSIGDSDELTSMHIRRALRIMNITVVLFVIFIVLPILLLESILFIVVACT